MELGFHGVFFLKFSKSLFVSFIKKSEIICVDNTELYQRVKFQSNFFVFQATKNDKSYTFASFENVHSASHLYIRICAFFC
jgi:hypothetical protein